MRILLADDEILLLEVFSAILTDAGHEVEKATSGEEAFEKARSGKYDVIVSDIQMRGKIDGLDIYEEFSESTQVILMTGGSEKANEAREKGATVLFKPLTSIELLNAVGGIQ